MKRILNAGRLQYVGWRYRLAWPWFILALSFAVNLAFYASFDDAIDGPQVTGGILAIFAVELIFSAQSITQVFPFALGLSMTRRSFAIATLLSILARSLAFAIILGMLKLLEDATGGWGFSMLFFSVLGQDNLILLILSFTMLFVLLDLEGAIGGLVFLRWGLNGMLTLIAAVGAAVGGTAALLTWQEQWGRLSSWFADQPAAALIAGWPLLVVAVLAGAGFLVIRRATPA